MNALGNLCRPHFSKSTESTTRAVCYWLEKHSDTEVAPVGLGLCLTSKAFIKHMKVSLQRLGAISRRKDVFIKYDKVVRLVSVYKRSTRATTNISQISSTSVKIQLIFDRISLGYLIACCAITF